MLRFCWGREGDLRTGDWVVVGGPLGDESGRVLFGADDVDAPAQIELSCTIERRLSDAELSEVESRLERARALTCEVERQGKSVDSSFEMASLRLSLDGTTILCSLFGQLEVGRSSLEQVLEERMGQPVRLELMDRAPVTYGSVGRLRTGTPVDEQALHQRMGVGRLSGNPRPNGWPRLGCRVRAGETTGTLSGISMRHGTATIRLESGEDIAVPEDELEVVEP